MRRHELDPVSVLGGLVFLLVAGGYALGHGSDVHVRWLFALPAALIAVGAALVAVVIRGTSEPRVEAEPGHDTTDLPD